MTCRTYDQWLREQPSYFQEEILKEETLIAFRSGVEQEKFIDENYQPINLDRLKQLDSRDLADK